MFLEHEKYTKVPIIITANNLLNHLKGSLSAPVDTIITAGSAQVYGVIKTKCWEWQIDTKGYWSGDLTGLLHSVTISGRPAIPASLAEIGPIRKIQLTMSNLGTDPNNESTHIELVVKPLQIKPQ